MRLRCLHAIKDDLHDYAEACAQFAAEWSPITARQFGPVDCGVLHRVDNFQTELIVMPPNTLVPSHHHPGVDSVDILLAGSFEELQVGSFKLTARWSKIGFGVRIPALEEHAAIISSSGVKFLSCQRWTSAPSHIGLAWRGRAMTPEHQALVGG